MNWALLWLGLMVFFLIVEGICPCHLVSIWFAAGAVVAIAVALLGGSPALQIGIFLVISCALLAALWPLTRKFLKPRRTATNVDSVIGSAGIVTASVDNLAAVGQVKLGGMEWSARSTSGSPIAQGTRIRVDRVEGVKVFVSPAEIPASQTISGGK